jgi:HEAT repeat protein
MSAKIVPFHSSQRLLDTIRAYIDGSRDMVDGDMQRVIGLLLEGMKLDDPALKLKIVFFLGSQESKHVIAPLYHLMHAKEQSETTRRIAAIQLSVVAGMHADDRSLCERLIGDLSADDAVVRANAAFALGWEGNTMAADDLIKCLQDKDSEVQQAAISALCNIGDEHLCALLVNTLMRGDRERKRALLFHLYRRSSQNKTFEKICVHFLGDTDAELRYDALLVFNSISDPLDNLPRYQCCLQDEDARVRSLALALLGDVDVNRLEPLKDHIQRLLHDPEPNVQQAAIRLFNQIPPLSVFSSMGPHPDPKARPKS